MNKNSTSTQTFTPDKDKMKEGPSAMTIAKIKQFARAYSFSKSKIAPFGGIVLN